MKISKGMIYSVYYNEFTTSFLDKLSENISAELELQPYELTQDETCFGPFELRRTIAEQISTMKWNDLPLGKIGMIFYLFKDKDYILEPAAMSVVKLVIMLKDRSLIPPLDFDNIE